MHGVTMKFMVNTSFGFVHNITLTNSRNVFELWFLLNFLRAENEMHCPSDAFILNPRSVTL